MFSHYYYEFFQKSGIYFTTLNTFNNSIVLTKLDKQLFYLVTDMF